MIDKELYAFWHYDIYPYCLYGKVKDIDKLGFVYIEKYCSWFKPLFIVPENEGRLLSEKLDILQKAYKEELDSLNDKYNNALLDFPFEIIKD